MLGQLIAGDLRPRRRGRLRVALVRGVPDPRDAGRRDAGAGAARRRRAARPGGDGGRDHRRAPGWCWSAPRTTRPARRSRDAELEAFLERCPRDVLVVIDEAYLEFVTTRSRRTRSRSHRRRPNVAVLRTFSKAYGLAGLRVGYAVAHEPVAQALRKTAMPFGVMTRPGGGRRVPRGVRRARGARRGAGRRAHPRRGGAARAGVGRCPRPRPTSCGCRWGTTRWLRRGVDEAGLIVRPFPGDGVRCTIAETEANDLLIAVAGRFRQGVGS